MTKAEQNKILEGLWKEVNLNDFKDDIVLMSHLITKDHQIQLMEKMIGNFPPNHKDYQGLKAQVAKAVTDSKK